MADYGQNATQAGDVLMIHSEDRGDIIVEGGITRMTPYYETFIYLILFGSNEDDDGSEATEKLQWWGNEGEPPERQYRGRFHGLIGSGRPVTSAFIQELQAAAQEDLEKGLDGYYETIGVSVSLLGPKHIYLKGKILFKTGESVPLGYEVAA